MGFATSARKPGQLPFRLLAVLSLAAAMVALGGAPASASCAEPPELEDAFAEAEVVFIGVVVDLSYQDRTAVMQVEEVWKGPELPEVVTVRGGPELPDGLSSVDRTFERGTYVVFPVNSEPPFEDNLCTLTQRTSPALDVINPHLAEPTEDPNQPEPVTTTIAGTAGNAPPVTDADAGDEVVAKPEQPEEVGVAPWEIAAVAASALLLLGAYAMVQRRSG